MPQMAPLSWLTLFIMFSSTLILFNVLNYFSFLPTSPSSSAHSSISTTPLNWKW
uniref:ATP synthase F0 subunit 8 n=1 Tax=Deleatidium vernale TaxID=1968931 RepID=UPI0028D88524|nr:ATP synthase F0 subunit 8 [Deleatidium vernale]WMQ76567.1 ATP synthase F0 subunit 8 [Deleatidium vernale]